MLLPGNIMNTLKYLEAVILISMLSCSAGGSSESPENPVGIKEGKPIVFHKTNEPNEQAFSFVLPEGWAITGGVTRVDPATAGGSGNSVEAKLYMRLSSPDQKAGMGWLPDTRFFDIRRYSGANLAATMFPDGSNYNGMLVMPIPSPVEFISGVAIPFAHPHANQIKINEVKPLPELSEQFRALSSKMIPGYAFSYNSAIVTFEYTENGILYLEKMVCVIEDYGQLGAGLWGNKECWYVRAVKDEFNKMAPVFATIGHSVKLNPEWISREIRSQQVNSSIALQTQQAVAEIDREITKHRARTNSEINNDMYLNLTGQEDYTNPFTGETERGTNEWNYRWENEQGDIIYHNNSNYNPNDDVNLTIKGFKKSEIKKR
jgi:hypothetical protein